MWNTIAAAYNQLQTSGMKTVDELKEFNKSLQKSAKLDVNKEKVCIILKEYTVCINAEYLYFILYVY